MSLAAAFLLCALAGAAHACDLQSMSTQTEHMNDKCCAHGACDGTGVPAKCNTQCRPAFETFWSDCGAYMNYLPGTESMKNFAKLCEDGKPDEVGSKVTSCDAGTLLTTLLFSCSGVDQNNAQEFCGTECSRAIEDFQARCKHKPSVAGRAALDAAEGWLLTCKEFAVEPPSCHSKACNGAHDTHCAKADSRGECAELDADDNNVFCAWQVCKGRGGGAPPPPPVIKRPGCIDKKAINFDPKANVMAPGACLYNKPPPPPPFGPPPPTLPCNTHSMYGCKTKSACLAIKMQWVPCNTLAKFGGQCAGLSEEDGGQCTRCAICLLREKNLHTLAQPSTVHTVYCKLQTFPRSVRCIPESDCDAVTFSEHASTI